MILTWKPASQDPTDYAASPFRKCWNMDTAAPAVRRHVLINADGARRAVYACSPIKLPPGKYDSLKDIILNFDPRDAVR